MNKPVYAGRFASWAPGLNGPDDWKKWAEGKREIEQSPAGPVLEFTDPLFRRRLSQLSKMTIQVIHDIMPVGEKTKIVFVSFRGEICQQFKINRMLAEEGEMSPAAFSHSVFNTPPALAAIALDLRAGYSAVYPGGDCFATGFLAAAAPLLSGTAAETALVYADELCPPEYGRPCPPPLAFAVLLSASMEAAHPSGAAHLSEAGIPVAPGHRSLSSPADFLRFLYRNGESR